MVLALDASEFSLQVRSADRDPDEIAELTRNLREQILLTEVESVRPLATATAAGAKSGASATVGALVIAVAPVLVATVADVLASWLRRQQVDVEIEVDGERWTGSVTPAQRDEMVTAILRRLHAARE
ncbi:hypothetical protein ACIA8B_30285 [Micromonospora chalcea]|uniref:effector-associated constant component EACC1 n=1 Tax=Micromonospora aurantiaca (nom. illeg.) TaxID=47850 RepID=UPI0037AA1AF6